ESGATTEDVLGVLSGNSLGVIQRKLEGIRIAKTAASVAPTSTANRFRTEVAAAPVWWHAGIALGEADYGATLGVELTLQPTAATLVSHVAGRLTVELSPVTGFELDVVGHLQAAIQLAMQHCCGRSLHLGQIGISLEDYTLRTLGQDPSSDRVTEHPDGLWTTVVFHYAVPFVNDALYWYAQRQGRLVTTLRHGFKLAAARVNQNGPQKVRYRNVFAVRRSSSVSTPRSDLRVRQYIEAAFSFALGKGDYATSGTWLSTTLRDSLASTVAAVGSRSFTQMEKAFTTVAAAATELSPTSGDSSSSTSKVVVLTDSTSATLAKVSAAGWSVDPVPRFPGSVKLSMKKERSADKTACLTTSGGLALAKWPDSLDDQVAEVTAGGISKTFSSFTQVVVKFGNCDEVFTKNEALTTSATEGFDLVGSVVLSVDGIIKSFARPGETKTVTLLVHPNARVQVYNDAGRHRDSGVIVLHRIEEKPVAVTKRGNTCSNQCSSWSCDKLVATPLYPDSRIPKFSLFSAGGSAPQTRYPAKGQNSPDVGVYKWSASALSGYLLLMGTDDAETGFSTTTYAGSSGAVISRATGGKSGACCPRFAQFCRPAGSWHVEIQPEWRDPSGNGDGAHLSGLCDQFRYCVGFQVKHDNADGSLLGQLFFDADPRSADGKPLEVEQGVKFPGVKKFEYDTFPYWLPGKFRAANGTFGIGQVLTAESNSYTCFKKQITEAYTGFKNRLHTNQFKEPGVNMWPKAGYSMPYGGPVLKPEVARFAKKADGSPASIALDTVRVSSTRNDNYYESTYANGQVGSHYEKYNGADGAKGEHIGCYTDESGNFNADPWVGLWGAAINADSDPFACAQLCQKADAANKYFAIGGSWRGRGCYCAKDESWKRTRMYDNECSDNCGGSVFAAQFNDDISGSGGRFDSSVLEKFGGYYVCGGSYNKVLSVFKLLPAGAPATQVRHGACAMPKPGARGESSSTVVPMFYKKSFPVAEVHKCFEACDHYTFFYCKGVTIKSGFVNEHDPAIATYDSAHPDKLATGWDNYVRCYVHFNAGLHRDKPFFDSSWGGSRDDAAEPEFAGLLTDGGTATKAAHNPTPAEGGPAMCFLRREEAGSTAKAKMDGSLQKGETCDSGEWYTLQTGQDGVGSATEDDCKALCLGAYLQMSKSCEAYGFDISTNTCHLFVGSAASFTGKLFAPVDSDVNLETDLSTAATRVLPAAALAKFTETWGKTFADPTCTTSDCFQAKGAMDPATLGMSVATRVDFPAPVWNDEVLPLGGSSPVNMESTRGNPHTIGTQYLARGGHTFLEARFKMNPGGTGVLAAALEAQLEEAVRGAVLRVLLSNVGQMTDVGGSNARDRGTTVAANRLSLDYFVAGGAFKSWASGQQTAAYRKVETDTLSAHRVSVILGEPLEGREYPERPVILGVHLRDAGLGSVATGVLAVLNAGDFPAKLAAALVEQAAGTAIASTLVAKRGPGEVVPPLMERYISGEAAAYVVSHAEQSSAEFRVALPASEVAAAASDAALLHKVRAKFANGNWISKAVVGALNLQLGLGLRGEQVATSIFKAEIVSGAAVPSGTELLVRFAFAIPLGSDSLRSWISKTGGSKSGSVASAFDKQLADLSGYATGSSGLALLGDVKQTHYLDTRLEATLKLNGAVPSTVTSTTTGGGAPAVPLGDPASAISSKSELHTGSDYIIRQMNGDNKDPCDDCWCTCQEMGSNCCHSEGKGMTLQCVSGTDVSAATKFTWKSYANPADSSMVGEGFACPRGSNYPDDGFPDYYMSKYGSRAYFRPPKWNWDERRPVPTDLIEAEKDYAGTPMKFYWATAVECTAPCDNKHLAHVLYKDPTGADTHAAVGSSVRGASTVYATGFPHPGTTVDGLPINGGSAHEYKHHNYAGFHIFGTTAPPTTTTTTTTTTVSQSFDFTAFVGQKGSAAKASAVKEVGRCVLQMKSEEDVMEGATRGVRAAEKTSDVCATSGFTCGFRVDADLSVANASTVGDSSVHVRELYEDAASGPFAKRMQGLLPVSNSTKKAPLFRQVIPSRARPGEQYYEAVGRGRCASHERGGASASAKQTYLKRVVLKNTKSTEPRLQGCFDACDSEASCVSVGFEDASFEVQSANATSTSTVAAIECRLYLKAALANDLPRGFELEPTTGTKAYFPQGVQFADATAAAADSFGGCYAKRGNAVQQFPDAAGTESSTATTNGVWFELAKNFSQSADCESECAALGESCFGFALDANTNKCLLRTYKTGNAVACADGNAKAESVAVWGQKLSAKVIEVQKLDGRALTKPAEESTTGAAAVFSECFQKTFLGKNATSDLRSSSGDVMTLRGNNTAYEVVGRGQCAFEAALVAEWSRSWSPSKVTRGGMREDFESCYALCDETADCAGVTFNEAETGGASHSCALAFVSAAPSAPSDWTEATSGFNAGRLLAGGHTGPEVYRPQDTGMRYCMKKRQTTATENAESGGMHARGSVGTWFQKRTMVDALSGDASSCLAHEAVLPATVGSGAVARDDGARRLLVLGSGVRRQRCVYYCDVHTLCTTAVFRPADQTCALLLDMTAVLGTSAGSCAGSLAMMRTGRGEVWQTPDAAAVLLDSAFLAQSGKGKAVAPFTRTQADADTATADSSSIFVAIPGADGAAQRAMLDGSDSVFRYLVEQALADEDASEDSGLTPWVKPSVKAFDVLSERVGIRSRFVIELREGALTEAGVRENVRSALRTAAAAGLAEVYPEIAASNITVGVQAVAEVLERDGAGGLSANERSAVNATIPVDLAVCEITVPLAAENPVVKLGKENTNSTMQDVAAVVETLRENVLAVLGAPEARDKVTKAEQTGSLTITKTTTVGVPIARPVKGAAKASNGKIKLKPVREKPTRKPTTTTTTTTPRLKKIPKKEDAGAFFGDALPLQLSYSGAPLADALFASEDSTNVAEAYYASIYGMDEGDLALTREDMTLAKEAANAVSLEKSDVKYIRSRMQLTVSFRGAKIGSWVRNALADLFATSLFDAFSKEETEEATGPGTERSTSQSAKVLQRQLAEAREFAGEGSLIASEIAVELAPTADDITVSLAPGSEGAEVLDLELLFKVRQSAAFAGAAAFFTTLVSAATSDLSNDDATSTAPLDSSFFADLTKALQDSKGDYFPVSSGGTLESVVPVGVAKAAPTVADMRLQFATALPFLPGAEGVAPTVEEYLAYTGMSLSELELRVSKLAQTALALSVLEATGIVLQPEQIALMLVPNSLSPLLQPVFTVALPATDTSVQWFLTRQLEKFGTEFVDPALTNLVAGSQGLLLNDTDTSAAVIEAALPSADRLNGTAGLRRPSYESADAAAQKACTKVKSYFTRADFDCDTWSGVVDAVGSVGMHTYRESGREKFAGSSVSEQPTVTDLMVAADGTLSTVAFGPSRLAQTRRGGGAGGASLARVVKDPATVADNLAASPEFEVPTAELPEVPNVREDEATATADNTTSTSATAADVSPSNVVGAVDRGRKGSLKHVISLEFALAVDHRSPVGHVAVNDTNATVSPVQKPSLKAFLAFLQSAVDAEMKKVLLHFALKDSAASGLQPKAGTQNIALQLAGPADVAAIEGFEDGFGAFKNSTVSVTAVVEVDTPEVLSLEDAKAVLQQLTDAVSDGKQFLVSIKDTLTRDFGVPALVALPKRDFAKFAAAQTTADYTEDVASAYTAKPKSVGDAARGQEVVGADIRNEPASVFLAAKLAFTLFREVAPQSRALVEQEDVTLQKALTAALVAAMREVALKDVLRSSDELGLTPFEFHDPAVVLNAPCKFRMNEEAREASITIKGLFSPEVVRTLQELLSAPVAGEDAEASSTTATQRKAVLDRIASGLKQELKSLDSDLRIGEDLTVAAGSSATLVGVSSLQLSLDLSKIPGLSVDASTNEVIFGSDSATSAFSKTPAEAALRRAVRVAVAKAVRSALKLGDADLTADHVDVSMDSILGVGAANATKFRVSIPLADPMTLERVLDPSGVYAASFRRVLDSSLKEEVKALPPASKALAAAVASGSQPHTQLFDDVGTNEVSPPVASGFAKMRFSLHSLAALDSSAVAAAIKSATATALSATMFSQEADTEKVQRAEAMYNLPTGGSGIVVRFFDSLTGEAVVRDVEAFAQQFNLTGTISASSARFFDFEVSVALPTCAVPLAECDRPTLTGLKDKVLAAMTESQTQTTPFASTFLTKMKDLGVPTLQQETPLAPLFNNGGKTSAAIAKTGGIPEASQVSSAGDGSVAEDAPEVAPERVPAATFSVPSDEPVGGVFLETEGAIRTAAAIEGSSDVLSETEGASYWEKLLSKAAQDASETLRAKLTVFTSQSGASKPKTLGGILNVTRTAQDSSVKIIGARAKPLNSALERGADGKLYREQRFKVSVHCENISTEQQGYILEQLSDPDSSFGRAFGASVEAGTEDESKFTPGLNATASKQGYKMKKLTQAQKVATTETTLRVVALPAADKFASFEVKQFPITPVLHDLELPVSSNPTNYIIPGTFGLFVKLPPLNTTNSSTTLRSLLPASANKCYSASDCVSDELSSSVLVAAEEERKLQAASQSVVKATTNADMLGGRKCLSGEYYSSLNGYNADEDRTVVLQVAYPTVAALNVSSEKQVLMVLGNEFWRMTLEAVEVGFVTDTNLISGASVELASDQWLASRYSADANTATASYELRGQNAKRASDPYVSLDIGTTVRDDIPVVSLRSSYTVGTPENRVLFGTAGSAGGFGADFEGCILSAKIFTETRNPFLRVPPGKRSAYYSQQKTALAAFDANAKASKADAQKIYRGDLQKLLDDHYYGYSKPQLWDGSDAWSQDRAWKKCRSSPRMGRSGFTLLQQSQGAGGDSKLKVTLASSST
ncbi:unnamed protein product, partial [Amoebophrya sp. A25]